MQEVTGEMTTATMTFKRHFNWKAARGLRLQRLPKCVLAAHFGMQNLF